MGGLFGIYNSRRGETHPAQKGENQIDAGQSRGCAPLKRLSRWISGWGRQRKSSTKKEAEVDIFFVCVSRQTSAAGWKEGERKGGDPTSIKTWKNIWKNKKKRFSGFCMYLFLSSSFFFLSLSAWAFSFPSPGLKRPHAPTLPEKKKLRKVFQLRGLFFFFSFCSTPFFYYFRAASICVLCVNVRVQKQKGKKVGGIWPEIFFLPNWPSITLI